jgi:hypothetical protein
MPPEATDLASGFLWAKELLDCACEALGDANVSPYGCPERACVYNGGVEVAFDDCCVGQLWVSWGRTYPTSSFPVELSDRDLTACLAHGTYLATDFEVGIIRCAPTLDEQGNPPSCEAIEQSALQMHHEARVILRAVTCCMKEWTADTARPRYGIWREQVPAGDGGLCVGSVLKVTVGEPLCTCFPGIVLSQP